MKQTNKKHHLYTNTRACRMDNSVSLETSSSYIHVGNKTKGHSLLSQ